jgi:hypothetical protein
MVLLVAVSMVIVLLHVEDKAHPVKALMEVVRVVVWAVVVVVVRVKLVVQEQLPFDPVKAEMV